MPHTTNLSEERIQNSSDEESESSKSPETGLASKGKPERVQKNSKSKSSTIDLLLDKDSSNESDASESSSKSSTSSVSAGSKRKAVESTKTTSKSPAKKPKTSLANVKRVESATYVPPQSYTANKMQSSEITSQTQGIFKDLDGKQIWQFSAPASFPISKFEWLNVENALNGEPFLHHKGVSYTISRGDPGEKALLTPKPNGDYVCAASVSRVFLIRGTSDTTIGIENRTDGTLESSQPTHRGERAVIPSKHDVFFATQIGQKKPPRTQPCNLRARYIPYGVVTEATDADNGMAQDGDAPMPDVSPEPVTLKQTHSQATPRPSKKSKTKQAHSPEITVEATPSKRKKEKSLVSSSQVELSANDSSQKRRKEKSKK